MFEPDKHHRRSVRLRGFDYRRPGAYFITVCVLGRECLLGKITAGVVQESAYGEVVRTCWEALPAHYSNVELDAFVVMPNHVHGVILLGEDPGRAGLRPMAGLRPAPTAVVTKRHGVPELVRAFKAFSARQINGLRGTERQPVWQRNYYEHIVRDERDLDRIRRYIKDNPLNWEKDPENPAIR